MAVKLEYNPSTGKLSWNTVTGKLSVVDDGVFGPKSTLPGVVCDCFGAGLTPRFYTLIVEGVIDCPTGSGSGANGTYKCEINPEFHCYWAFTDGTESGFVLYNTNEVSINVKTGVGFGYNFVDTITPYCEYKCGSEANSYTLGSCTGIRIGYDGSAKWTPYWYEPWASGTVYVVGDIASHENEFYSCIQNHTSCDIIDCPGQDEPGTGANWEDYWVISTEEC